VRADELRLRRRSDRLLAVAAYEFHDRARDRVHLLAEAADELVVDLVVRHRLLDVHIEAHVLGQQVGLEADLELLQGRVDPMEITGRVASAPSRVHRHQYLVAILQSIHYARLVSDGPPRVLSRLRNRLAPATL